MFYLSVLAQFKNETMNLKVWIDHYLWQGVDHFYLIDNDSTDNPMDILKPYIDKGIVSYYYKPKKYMQSENYKWVFDHEKLKTKTYWLAICDLDEFFYGVDRKLVSKLKTLEFYNVIYCNWLLFGNNDIIDHPPDIRTAFTRRKPNMDETNTKYIFKPLAIKDSSQIWLHWLLTSNNSFSTNNISQLIPKPQVPIKSGKKVWIANKLIRLNHYVIQSVEYFTKVKSVRGDAESIKDNNKWSKDFFDRHNVNCTTTDETLKKLVENPPIDY
jgi:hypothetical protein